MRRRLRPGLAALTPGRGSQRACLATPTRSRSPAPTEFCPVARLVIGGTELPDGLEPGWYVKPSLCTSAANTMRIAREEIFGLAITVVPYRAAGDAVTIAHDSDCGLAGAVWTLKRSR